MLRRFVERAMMIFTMEIEKMTIDEYQIAAARTLTVEPAGTYTNDQVHLALSVLDLCQVVAGLAEYIKKMIFRKKIVDTSSVETLLRDVQDVTSQCLKAVGFQDYADLDPAYVVPQRVAILQHSLGLFGEAGELIRELNSCAGSADPAAVAEEAGDVLWKLAALCSLHNLSLGDVMQANIAKLLKRRPPP